MMSLSPKLSSLLSGAGARLPLLGGGARGAAALPFAVGEAVFLAGFSQPALWSEKPATFLLLLPVCLPLVLAALAGAAASAAGAALLLLPCKALARKLMICSSHVLAAGCIQLAMQAARALADAPGLYVPELIPAFTYQPRSDPLATELQGKSQQSTSAVALRTVKQHRTGSSGQGRRSAAETEQPPGENTRAMSKSHLATHVSSCCCQRRATVCTQVLLHAALPREKVRAASSRATPIVKHLAPHEPHRLNADNTTRCRCRCAC